MDPITSAILAALPTLASQLVTSSVKDAYEGLKTIIRRKWGETSTLSGALTSLEANPGSKGHALVLSESLTEAKATDDKELMHAVAELIAALKKEGFSDNSGMKINIRGGNQGVVGATNVSVGTMTVGGTKT